MKKKVIVIGAGASGMMAAITAGRNNANVTILEHTEKIGKKILATGNGKCNITNHIQKPEFYRSDNEEFPWKIVSKFDYKQTLEFFDGIGILLKEKKGYVYPNSEQASSVLDSLVMELDNLGIEVINNVDIFKISSDNGIISIATSKETYFCDNVIICTGSKAAPNTGSDGSGYELAKAIGHTIIKPLPALIQLRCEGNFFKQVAGVRFEGLIQAYVDGKMIAQDCGELQLTDYGVSGIPTFQISRYISKALDEKKAVDVIVDYMPQFDIAETKDFFINRINQFRTRTLEELFVGVLNKKLALAIIKKVHLSPNIEVVKLSDKQISVLIKEIKEFKVKVTGTNSYDKAQVCLGGVDTRELTENMESKLMQNVYFAGEIVDVDGICGGYNLQWAWSSGYVAGLNAAK